MDNGELAYAHRQDSNKAERIPLTKTFVIATEIHNSEHVFALILKAGHVYYFQATSAFTLQIWIDLCIRNGSQHR